MKIYVAAGVAAALLAAGAASSATLPDVNGPTAQMVITVRPAKGATETGQLKAGDLTVTENNARTPVVGLERLAGDLSDMQLFLLLDDSARSASLSVHFPELKRFIENLPPSTQVAVGYMRNGTFVMAQPFTTDHREAARSLRLPLGLPGENGSPYFALGDLAKHWPAKQASGRRAVLMLTDGVDRYYSTPDLDDPYVNAAMHDALKQGVLVYSIYLRDAGLYGRRGLVRDLGQSYLIQTGEETGGYAYFETFTDPVDIAPFLSDFQDRLAHQYRVTIQALNEKGVQPVKVRAEAPGLKIDAPTRVYVP